ncbi:MAG: zinc dependent phospholipase C family protein [Alphaproteobacteria bacterium]|nr:zinc dependent phospholipase C family protein [Alphaproteobacteria bacterium]
MPRDLTHVIFADDIVAGLPEQSRADIEKYPNALHMGAICPDSFLYGSSPVLSTVMHGGLGDDTRSIVLSMLDGVREENDPEKKAMKKAFAMGYMTHMAVDQEFHPFVYSLSGSQSKENNADELGILFAKARHRAVETWMDVHFMNEKGYDFDNFRPMRKIVHDIKNSRELTHFFCDSFKTAYPEQHGVDAGFRTGFGVQLLVGKVTQNQTIAGVLHRMDKVLNGKLLPAVAGFYREGCEIPKAITDVEEFKHPVSGTTVYSSMETMKENAISLGRDYIKVAEEYIQNGDREQFNQKIKNINLDTGVENTKLSDNKVTKPRSIKELLGTKFHNFMNRGPIRRLHSGAKNEQARQQAVLKKIQRGRD